MRLRCFFLFIIGCVLLVEGYGQNVPVAQNDTFYTNYNKEALLYRAKIILNDFDIDNNLKIIDTISYAGLGLVEVTNYNAFLKVLTIKYTPPVNFYGKDSITYYLTDNGNPTGYDTAFIYIYVKRKPYENLDVNNINATIHKDVLFESDNSVKGFNTPKNSDLGTIYASNLWIAGEDSNGDLRVSATTFKQYTSKGNGGPIMDSIHYDYYNYEWDRVWKINYSDIEFHQSNWNITGYQAVEVIANWPAHGDTTKGQAFYLAPFVDVDNDGLYNPLMGDYPKIKGQQAIYFIQNDKRDTVNPNINRIGVEIHGIAYAFNCSSDSALNNTVFVNYKVYNRSDSVLYNTYIGLWSDIDIGGSYDDYFATDVFRGSFYGYNRDSFDEDYLGVFGYGNYPPAQSVTFLKGPKQPSDGIDNPLTTVVQNAIDSFGIPYQGLGVGFGDGIIDNEYLGLTYFLTYEIDSVTPTDELTYSSDYYHYLTGRFFNGQHMTWGGDGIPFSTGGTIPTSFMFPGNSDSLFWSTQGVIATPNNWTDVTSKDRRGVGSCGPFTLMPDSAVELDLAFVFARNYTDTSNVAAVPIMQNRIDVIRQYFNDGFTNEFCPEILVEEEPINDSLGLIVPNVFTPNNDGFNDNFVLYINGSHLFDNIKIEVFNRWGHSLRETAFNASTLVKLPTTNGKKQLTIWDGTTSTGIKVPVGTYYYVINYLTVEGESKTVKGFLTLLR